jgi:hypothetical protein
MNAIVSVYQDMVDQRVVTYLATIAGKHPRRFCSPKLASIRFAAAWAEPDDAIEQRLVRLCEIGRIERAVSKRNGELTHGFIVLPNKIWKLQQRAVLTDLALTAYDSRFLRALRVAW